MRRRSLRLRDHSIESRRELARTLLVAHTVLVQSMLQMAAPSTCLLRCTPRTTTTACTYSTRCSRHRHASMHPFSSFQGTYPNGQPRKQRNTFQNAHPVKGDHYAVDMVWIVDSSVFDFFLERHHNYTVSALRHLVDYCALLMYEVANLRNYHSCVRLPSVLLCLGGSYHLSAAATVRQADLCQSRRPLHCTGAQAGKDA